MNYIDRLLIALVAILAGFFTFIYCLDSGPGNGLVFAGLLYFFTSFTLPSVIIGVLISYLSSGSVKPGLLYGLLTGTTLTFLTLWHLFTL